MLASDLDDVQQTLHGSSGSEKAIDKLDKIRSIKVTDLNPYDESVDDDQISTHRKKNSCFPIKLTNF